MRKIPVDERAIRAIMLRLNVLKDGTSNGYDVSFNRIVRMRAIVPTEMVLDPPELHIIGGALLEPTFGEAARRGAAFQWFYSFPITVVFYAKIATTDPDLEYRIYKSEIVRCLLGSEILDVHNRQVVLQPNNVPILDMPTYYDGPVGYVSGVIQFSIGVTFEQDDMRLYDGADTMVDE
ncbi:MAG: hypothetical protein QXS54_01595 [Candidatus Methanomethylicaceae archaeon]